MPTIGRRFEGMCCVVTGGGAGIGAAICSRLVHEGGSVVVADVDAPAAQRVAQQLCVSHPGRAMAFEVDTSQEHQVEALVCAAVTFGGGSLHVLINNAARFVFAGAGDATSEQWDQALATNVKGYAFCTKHASKAMAANGGSSTAAGGAIVNVSSISAFVAQPGFVPYSATKAAILAMTRCCALDLGPLGIRVNALCPGPVLTDGTRRHAASQGKSLDAITREMNSGMIVKRMGEPSEVAAAAAFLASTDSSFVTGTTLLVDGGYTSL